MAKIPSKKIFVQGQWLTPEQLAGTGKHGGVGLNPIDSPDALQAQGRAIKEKSFAKHGKRIQSPALKNFDKLMNKRAITRVPYKLGGGAARIASKTIAHPALAPVHAGIMARDYLAPQIEEQQAVQMTREAGYNPADAMSPEAQMTGGEISMGRTGIGAGGAGLMPLEQQQWPAVVMGEDGQPQSAPGTMPAYVQRSGMTPTQMHQYATDEQLQALVNRSAPAIAPPPVPEPTPDDTGGGSASGSGLEYNYEYNPSERKFEARPYQARKLRAPSITDILGGTRLSGLGGLFAVNLASKMAASKANELAADEGNRQKEAKSGLDWQGLSLDSDKLALAESLAPSEAAKNMAQAKLAETTSKSQTGKGKIFDTLVKKGVDMMAQAAELRASGMTEEADRLEMMGLMIAQGQYPRQTAAAIPEEKAGILSRLFGGKDKPATPAQYDIIDLQPKLLR